jgi:hypothetical protein
MEVCEHEFLLFECKHICMCIICVQYMRLGSAGKGLFVFGLFAASFSSALTIAVVGGTSSTIALVGGASNTIAVVRY